MPAGRLTDGGGGEGGGEVSGAGGERGAGALGWNTVGTPWDTAVGCDSRCRAGRQDGPHTALCTPLS